MDGLNHQSLEYAFDSVTLQKALDDLGFRRTPDRAHFLDPCLRLVGFGLTVFFSVHSLWIVLMRNRFPKSRGTLFIAKIRKRDDTS